MKTIIYTPRPSLVARRFGMTLHAEQPSQIAASWNTTIHFHPDHGIICEYLEFTDLTSLLTSAKLPIEESLFTPFESLNSTESSTDSPESLPETLPSV